VQISVIMHCRAIWSCCTVCINIPERRRWRKRRENKKRGEKNKEVDSFLNVFLETSSHSTLSSGFIKQKVFRSESFRSSSLRPSRHPPLSTSHTDQSSRLAVALPSHVFSVSPPPRSFCVSVQRRAELPVSDRARTEGGGGGGDEEEESRLVQVVG